MARMEIVIGSGSLSASLAAGSGLIQMEQIGGYQTFDSSSYNSGRSGSQPEHEAGPIDAREWRLTWET